jgi:DNA topoisomerase-3
MSTVILAEKPSQALAYASALKQSTKKDGYFEIKDPLFTDETFITFGFGHLVELAEPGHYDEKWQNWKLESLPIFPDRYDFEVAKDKGKQFKIVAELLKKANTIIVAKIATEKVKISPGRLSIKQMPFQKIKHLKDYGSIA